MQKLLVASGNKKKLRELEAILSDLDVELVSFDQVGEVPEVVEDRETFTDNAIKKAVEVAEATGFLTLADDSGLQVDALDCDPGVRSARFAGEDKNDLNNCRKVLDLMKDVPDEKRTARFICVIAIATPERLVGNVGGKCEGFITREMKGENGFGYDPIFYYPEFKKTFAELSAGEKNKVSHRSKALKKAKELLTSYLQDKGKGGQTPDTPDN